MIRRLTARDARLSSFRFYDLLVHIFVVILLISNLVGQKMCIIPINIFGWVPHVSGAQLLFPITYIFGDIFTEVYGYGASRRAIWYTSESPRTEPTKSVGRFVVDEKVST